MNASDEEMATQYLEPAVKDSKLSTAVDSGADRSTSHHSSHPGSERSRDVSENDADHSFSGHSESNNNKDEAHHHLRGASASRKRIKKNIIEIDGQPWLCDDKGKPIKKLRKKLKEGEKRNSVRRERRRSHDSPKKKNNKELRKGDPEPTTANDGKNSARRERRQSRGDRDKVGVGHHGRHRRMSHVVQRSKLESVEQDFSYTDSLGRKHVFDEFGFNETVFDCNGEKIEESQPGDDGCLLDHVMESSGGPDSEDIADVQSSLNLSPSKENAGDPDEDPDELSTQNKQLLAELKKAKDERRELEEQVKREKSKNMKTQAEMLSLKAKFTEASTELKDLRSKMEMERASAQQEIANKDKQIANMNRQMGITLKKLLTEMEEIEEKYTAEKEKNRVQKKILDEMIEALETVNTDLSKQKMSSNESPTS